MSSRRSVLFCCWVVGFHTAACGAGSKGDQSSRQSVSERSDAAPVDDVPPSMPASVSSEAQLDSGTSTSATLGFEECENLGRQAQLATNELLSEVPRCTIDADCVGRPMPEHCWPSCGALVVGSTGYLEALEDALSDGSAADYCSEFADGQCVVAAHSCPFLREPTGYLCVDGECAAQYAD